MLMKQNSKYPLLLRYNTYGSLWDLVFFWMIVHLKNQHAATYFTQIYDALLPIAIYLIFNNSKPSLFLLVAVALSVILMYFNWVNALYFIALLYFLYDALEFKLRISLRSFQLYLVSISLAFQLCNLLVGTEISIRYKMFYFVVGGVNVAYHSFLRLYPLILLRWKKH